MSSSSEFVVIRDPRRAKHPFLVGADGYWQCAACPLLPRHDRHCMTRNDDIYVVVHDAALSTVRLAVARSLVAACVTGDQFAAAVRAQAAPRAVAA